MWNKVSLGNFKNSPEEFIFNHSQYTKNNQKKKFINHNPKQNNESTRNLQKTKTKNHKNKENQAFKNTVMSNIMHTHPIISKKSMKIFPSQVINQTTFP